ncbi:MAG: hypothetical protein JO270_13550 [Acidobacteriaceae bacterium]|nr:hypothetical protein [Acidobacteriaceae bacterium]
MNIDSARPGHWTDDQLIDYLYGVGPQDGHVDACGECRVRLAKIQARRDAVNFGSGDEIGHEFLAEQRRRIYARMAQPVRWWQEMAVRRWTSALATGGLLAAGMLYYESVQRPRRPVNEVTDAQLAQEVSSMAQDPEPAPTAPLQALFEE